MKKTLITIALISLCGQANGAPGELPSGYIGTVTNNTPNTWQTYTFNYTASTTGANFIGFAFRQDPAYWYFDNVRLFSNGSSANLLTNGNMSDGGRITVPLGTGTTLVTAPSRWGVWYQTGSIPYAAGRWSSYSMSWVDGAVGTFDGIYQGVNLTSGIQYSILFDVNGDDRSNLSDVQLGVYAGDCENTFLPARDCTIPSSYGFTTLSTPAQGEAASSNPNPPSVLSSSRSTIILSESDAVNTSRPIVVDIAVTTAASEASGKQTIAQATTTSVTTPMTHTLVTTVRTTSIWSDGTTTIEDATPLRTVTLRNDVVQSVANASFFGRVDQYEQLGQLNNGINRNLNSNLFRRDLLDTGTYRMWLTGGGMESDMTNYSAKSDIFSIGGEIDIKDNWIVGAQYNKVNTTLTGSDSKTKQDKNHLGAYSVFIKNNWILKTDFGYADNGINSNRNVEQTFFNASSTHGSDIWLSNRVYTADFKGFRPYAGYTFGKSKLDGYTETGSIQSFRTVGSVNNTGHYSEVGVRYEKLFNKLGLSGEVGTSSDNYTDFKATASYYINKKSKVTLSAGRQTRSDLSNNTVSATAVIDF